MDLTKMIPMDRNCAAELDLWTLQDFLGGSLFAGWRDA